MMNKTLFFSTLIFLALHLNLKAQTIHFFSAADTKNDIKAIAEACDQDYIKMDHHTLHMARVAKMEAKFYNKVKGENFRFDVLESEIKDMKVKSGEDIIFFYYTGTGNYLAEDDRWLNCKDRKGKISFIKNLLEAKNPKLLVLIFDTCSKALSGEAVPYEGTKAGKVNLYKHLFSCEGIVLAISSSKDEFGWALKNGSIFTQELINTFKSFQGFKDYSSLGWEDILRKTMDGTSSTAQGKYRMQTPFYIDRSECNKN